MNIKYRTQLGDLLDHFGLVGSAAEVGVAEGRNAQVLIKEPAITQLYLIDAWKQLDQKGDGGFDQSWHDNNFKEAHERTEEFAYKTVFLRGLSYEMIKLIPDESLVLAYIDGDHSYEGCLRDLRAIYPKLIKGGILAGHDYLNPRYGVGDAVETFAKEILPNQESVLRVHVIEEDEMPMAGFWFRKDLFVSAEDQKNTYHYAN